MAARWPLGFSCAGAADDMPGGCGEVDCCGTGACIRAASCWAASSSAAACASAAAAATAAGSFGFRLPKTNAEGGTPDRASWVEDVQETLRCDALHSAQTPVVPTP